MTYSCSHTSTAETFSWELFDHPSYSPHLAPSDYQMFTYLKNWVRSQSFKNNELVERSSQAADFFDTGIQKLIFR
jgi:hypothetical protein